MPLPLAFRLAAAVSLLTGLAAASQASDWGDVVAVSSTMGVHDGRVCVGEATRGDIGCPTYAPQVLPDGTVSATNGEFSRLRVISGTFAVNEGATNRGLGLQLNTDGFGKAVWQMRSNGSAPYPILIDVGDRKLLYVNYTTANRPAIGIGTTDPSTALHVSGTLRVADSSEACDANRVGAIRYAAGEFSFCRNGTVWETLSSISGDADRIVSGTTSLVAVSSTGFVSLTQAGTNTGWFDPARGLVTLGVSATGAVSATRGYFSGNMAIGSSTLPGINHREFMLYSDGPNTSAASGNAGATIYSQNRNAQLNLVTADRNANATVYFSPGLLPGNSGRGEITYHANSDASGMDMRFVVSNSEVMRLTSSSNVGIGTTNPTTRLEVNGTVSATRFVGDGSQLTGVVASTADRIVSGTTSLLAVSSTGFVSLTQAGTNTGWFDPARGLVTLGVSATGRISTTNLTVRGTIDIITGTGVVAVGQNAGINNTNSSNYLTAIGSNAAQNNSGSAVTSIGYTAGQNNTAHYLTAVGYQAGRYNSGNYVQALGYLAAANNTGGNVVALGTNAAAANSGSAVYVMGSYSAQYNTADYVNAMGGSAAQYNSGTYVNGIGYLAAQYNSGNYVDALGRSAAQYNSGTYVAGIGYLAAQYNIGSYVNALGRSAAMNNNSSHVNALGYTAAQANTGGHVNAFGSGAAQNNAGTYVEALGYQAAQNNTASDVIAIGRAAAQSNTFNNVVALGYNAQPDKANQIVLGNSSIVEVSTAGVLRSAGLNTSGTVTATRFVGDGSGLTNLQGASADRIVSGTTSMLAVSSTGFVSLTQAGTNTGWFDPARGLVTLGISTTGRISTTDLTVRGTIDIVTGTGVVAVGQNAGINNTNSSNYLTAIGHSAARYNSGSDVTAIGYGAAQYNSGSNVVGIGNGAAQYNNARYLSAIGYNSAKNNRGDYVSTFGFAAARLNSSSYVTAIGAGAAELNSASHATSVGYNAGSGNTGSLFTAMGSRAGEFNSGNNVTFVGYSAGTNNVGHQIVGIGVNAAANNTGADSNFIGSQAGYSNTGNNVNALGGGAARHNTGTYLDAIGFDAARYNTGSHVEAMGYNSAISNTGSFVVAIGREAAKVNTFNNVVALGYNAQPDKANQIVLGNGSIVEVSTAGVILARGVSTTDTVTATRFVGDGSGLTNLQGASADRIVSGTTSMLAVSSTGFVSLTQAGTNTGWFDPTRGLVTLGVSATGAVSATRGYFSGNTGFGVSTPLTAIDAAGALHVHDAGTAADNNYQGALRITRPSSAAQYINLVRAANAAWSIGTVYGTSNFAIGQGAFTDSSFTNPFFVINAIGQVGIGTTTPTAALDTAGAIHVHDTGTLADNSYQGALRITRPSSAAQYINLVRAGNAAWSIGTVYGTSNFAIGQGAFADSSFTNPFFVIGANGRVGIGIATPTVSLEVSGTISATDIKINGTSLAAPQNVTHVSQTGPIVFRDPSNSLRYLNNDTFYLRGFGWNVGNYPLVNIGTNQSTTSAYLSLGTLQGHQGLYIKDDSSSPLTRIFRIDSSTSGARAVSFFSNSYLHETRLYGNRLMLRGGENMANPYTLSLDTANNAIGVNTQSPTATLEVSGTVSATYVKLADNDDRPCAPEHNGTIRFFNGRISLCRAH